MAFTVPLLGITLGKKSLPSVVTTRRILPVTPQVQTKIFAQLFTIGNQPLSQSVASESLTQTLQQHRLTYQENQHGATHYIEFWTKRRQDNQWVLYGDGNRSVSYYKQS